GSSANPTATSCTTVFSLADCRAGIETPCRPTADRYALMTTSRAAMSATGSHQNRLLTTSAAMAPRTATLSASGSRNAPDRVVPWRRARKPSTPSVRATAAHSAVAGYDGPVATMTARSNGVTASRPIVTALAGVASAVGPNDASATAGLRLLPG